jgi:hypothetical protein
MSKRMTTEKRAEAARINGAKSRGPKTPEGKARSSQNAFKHGAYAQPVLLLANEDPAIFDSFRKGYVAKFQPADSVEASLVEEMVFAHWRMRRFWFVQDATIDIEINRQIPILEQEVDWISEPARTAKAITSLVEDSGTLDFLYRVESRCTRQFHRAMKDLLHLQALRKPPSTIFDGTNPSPSQPSPAQQNTPAKPSRHGLGAFPNFAAALFALALLGMLGYYGLQLGARFLQGLPVRQTTLRHPGIPSTPAAQTIQQWFEDGSSLPWPPIGDGQKDRGWLGGQRKEDSFTACNERLGLGAKLIADRVAADAPEVEPDAFGVWSGFLVEAAATETGQLGGQLAADPVGFRQTVDLSRHQRRRLLYGCGEQARDLGECVVVQASLADGTLAANELDARVAADLV